MKLKDEKPPRIEDPEDEVTALTMPEDHEKDDE